jgi:hypothetical protein
LDVLEVDFGGVPADQRNAEKVVLDAMRRTLDTGFAIHDAPRLVERLFDEQSRLRFLLRQRPPDVVRPSGLAGFGPVADVRRAYLPSTRGFAGVAFGFVFDGSVEVSSLVLLRAGSALFAELDSDDVEAADPLEVSDVRGPDAPAGADGGGGDESVVGADIDAGGGELSPEAGVGACAQEVEGEWWKGCEDGLDE